MAVFMINAEKAKSKASDIKAQKKELQSYSEQIVSIANKIRLGKEQEQIKKQLYKISNCISDSADECETLGSVLIEIVELYKKTEKEIVDGVSEKKSSNNNIGDASNSNDSSQNNSSGQNDILNKIKDKFDLSDLAVKTIKLILGFIPGVNCIVDIYDLVSDIKESLADGKISAGEALGLALDVVSLVGDVASFGALVKSMESVADGIKVAKTGGILEKGCNVAKKADDLKNRVNNTIGGTRIGNAMKNLSDKTDEASKKVVKKVLNDSTENKIKEKVTSKTADYVFSKSNKSQVTYNEVKNAAEKYSKEFMENMYGCPKSEVKSKVQDKIEEVLDGKDKKKK